MVPLFSKRLLIPLGLLPLMLHAATPVQQHAPEPSCPWGCPGWWLEDWEKFIDQRFDHASPYRYTTSSKMTENEKFYLISIDLPGIAKKDLNIETVGNRIMVSGERKDETEKKEKSSSMSEHSYSSFKQSFVLPDDADLGKIEAALKDGVLKISVPKTGKRVTKKVEIE